MAFGFLSNIVNKVENAAPVVGHTAFGFVKGLANQGTGLIKTDIVNPVKQEAAYATGNKQALANAQVEQGQNLQTVAPLVHGITRTVPETIATLTDRTDKGKTYTPGSNLEKAVFGEQPVQDIQAKVHGTTAQHGPVMGFLEGLASIAQDAPVLGTAAKVGKAAAPIAGSGIKQVASDVRFAGETGAVGTDVRPQVITRSPLESKELAPLVNSGKLKTQTEIVPIKSLKLGTDTAGVRADPKQVAQIKQDIQNGKTIDPLVVKENGSTNLVQDGQNRLKAYKELGITDIPVVKQTAPLTKTPVTVAPQLNGAAQQSFLAKSGAFLNKHFNPDDEGGYINLGGKGEPAIPGGEQKIPESVSSPESLTHDINTPLGTLRVTQDEMKAIQKASTPKEVKDIVGDALPKNVTEKIAPGLALAKDPNIIRNLIQRGVRETIPPEPVRPISVPSNIPTPPTAIDHITNALSEAQKTRSLQEQGYSAERSARAGAASGAAKDLTGSEAYFAKLAQLKGPLAKEDYQGLKGHLSPSEQNELYDDLHNQVEKTDQDFYGKLNTQTALRKVIFGEGGVPTNSEIKLLNNTFGQKFADSVKEDVQAHTQRVSTLKSFGQGAAEVAGVPRAIMASVDFSGGLRQGLAAATRHPAIFAKEWVKQFKSFASEDAYRQSLDAIENHPNFPLMRQAGLAIQDVGSHNPSEHEEQFVSTLAERIPGLGKLVHASNRAYTGLLSNLRANVFNQLVETSKNAGIDVHAPENLKLIKDFATVVNTSTGRGNLGRLEPAGQALSTALFAPRLIASRLSMLDPRYYVNLEPAARKEALTTLASLGAVTTTVLGLASAAGAQVSDDPTSADFGKIKVGDTRLDILGGYQQYLRLAAELALGRKTNSTTGAQTELGKGIAATRWDVLTSFLTNKEAPLPSLATTLLKGKDAAGNPVSVQHELLSRFTPLITQDIKDLYTHDNAVGGSAVGKPLAAAAGAFGVGLQTYSAQDNPLSTKQTAYIKQLQDNGADKQTIKASTSFFQNLKEASGTRNNVNSAIDKALAKNDLPEAQQLADQYNKELAAGIHKWNEKYGSYANSDLQSAYNGQKINLSGSSINQRLTAIHSTKPY